MQNLKIKILIVASDLYNPYEFWMTLKTFLKEKVSFKVIANSLYIADEKTGEVIKVNSTISDFISNELINISEYSALAFISGDTPKTIFHWTNPDTQLIIEKAIEHNIILAGICMAVPAIYKAVKEKKVSVFPIRRAIEVLEAAGAIINPVTVTCDGNIVTSENESGTVLWANTIIRLIKGEKVDLNLHQVPEGTFTFTRERRPIPEIERLKKVK